MCVQHKETTNNSIEQIQRRRKNASRNMTDAPRPSSNVTRNVYLKSNLILFLKIENFNRNCIYGK